MNDKPDNVVTLRPDAPLYGPPEPPPLNEFTAWNGVPLTRRAPLPPPEPWASAPWIPPPLIQGPHPRIWAGRIDGRDDIDSGMLIQFVALHQNISEEVACLTIQHELERGRLQATTPDGKVVDAWRWKRTAIHLDGSVSGWAGVAAARITVPAAEVLLVWPPPRHWLVEPGRPDAPQELPPAEATEVPPQTPTDAQIEPDESQGTPDAEKPSFDPARARTQLRILRDELGVLPTLAECEKRLTKYFGPSAVSRDKTRALAHNLWSGEFKPGRRKDKKPPIKAP